MKLDELLTVFARDNAGENTGSLMNAMLQKVAGFFDITIATPAGVPAIPGIKKALESWNPAPGDIIGLGAFYEKVISLNRSQRKISGSFYTQPEVVDYLVRNSLGQVKEENLRQMRILDPCCGGGAFLLGAFRFLREKGVPCVDILAVLHGVDIDPWAVQVTRFALLTEAASGGEDLDYALGWQKLCRNITVNNFLTLPDTDTYDVILGNPPYVANKKIPAQEKTLIEKNCRYLGRQYDLSLPFLEKGLARLSEGGRLAYITTNKYLAADYGQQLRSHLLNNYALEKIVDVSHCPVFKGTRAYPILLVVSRAKPRQTRIRAVKDLAVLPIQEEAVPVAEKNNILVNQKIFQKIPGYRIALAGRPFTYAILEKIEAQSGAPPFRKIRCGIANTGFNRFIATQEDYDRLPPEERDKYKPILLSRHILPYRIAGGQVYISREATNKALWSFFEGRRLVVAGMGKRIKAAVIDGNEALGRVYFVKEVACLAPLPLLMAFLNSSVIDFYYRTVFGSVHLAGGYLRVNGSYLQSLPYPDLFRLPVEQAEAVISLAERIAQSYIRGQTPSVEEKLIDDIFYDIYKLTKKEREIIENGG